MHTSELADLIKSRHSIRSWQDRTVPEDLLKQAVELATWAPNAENQQIWYFYIITDKKTINALGDAVQVSADYLATWPESSTAGEKVGRILKRPAFFRSAPAVVAVTAKPYITPLQLLATSRAGFDPRAKMIHDGNAIADARIQSIGAVVGYLLLVLHQLGLGAVWMTGPMLAKIEMEKLLKVPVDHDLVALIPVGYPAMIPASRGRKSLDEVCEVIR
jgi:nitroreductase